MHARCRHALEKTEEMFRGEGLAQALPEDVQQVVDVFREEESGDGAPYRGVHHRRGLGTLVGGQVAAALVLTGTHAAKWWRQSLSIV